MTKIIAFKVSDEEHAAIWKEATKVPGRSMTEYCRPLVLASLPQKRRPLPKPQGNPGGDSE